MFGTYRMVLALCVLLGHLLHIRFLGHHAVAGFFVLSGYLMTRIMHETYGSSFRGVMRFALNRFLRLFPAYWLVCGAVLLMLAVMGEERIRAVDSFVFVPRTGGEVVSNLTMIFGPAVPIEAVPRLSSPSWALTIELVFYALIALGLSRNRTVALLWLIASAAWTIGGIGFGMSYRLLHGALVSGSLPFALGSVLYHYRNEVDAYLGRRLRFVGPLFLTVCFVALAVATTVSSHMASMRMVKSAGYVLNLGLNFTLIAALARGGYSRIPKAIDDLLGGMSYPLYLVHMPVIAAVLVGLAGGAAGEGPLTVTAARWLSGMLAPAAALLIYLVVDRPVNRLRDAVKRGISA